MGSSGQSGEGARLALWGAPVCNLVVRDTYQSMTVMSGCSSSSSSSHKPSARRSTHCCFTVQL